MDERSRYVWLTQVRILSCSRLYVPFRIPVYQTFLHREHDQQPIMPLLRCKVDVARRFAVPSESYPPPRRLCMLRKILQERRGLYEARCVCAQKVGTARSPSTKASPVTNRWIVQYFVYCRLFVDSFIGLSAKLRDYGL